MKEVLFFFCFIFWLNFKIFFSLVGVLFLLCPWFSYGFFTRLRVLRRHPGILDFLFLAAIALHRSVFPIFLWFPCILVRGEVSE